MLMAADILLYDAEIVPVGKDQLQHLEMTRDVANRFNNLVGETLVAPQAKIQENGKLVPGTDGEKMSKSRNNIINIFLPDKKLRKQIMSIKTDSRGLEEPKDPDNDNIFGLYKLLASNAEIAEMRANYEGGNYGYGLAKQALYELIIEQFSSTRERYNHFMENKHEIDEALEIGAEKAATVATGVLQRVRAKIGY
jgi:tryptophanyl-tRNA synthetase